jgi:hypothetical protein
LLASRALAGAFDVPVGAAVPIVTTTIALLGSLAAWWLFQWANDRRRGKSLSPGRALGVGLSSLAAPALIGWATTVNASPFAAGIVTGILVLGLTAVVVCEGMRLTPDAPHSPARPPEKLAPSAVHPLRPPAALLSEAGLMQQFVRKQAADGCEQIEAVLLARFAPGERETAVHLPIHPNLQESPHVECEPLDGSPVSATVTTVQPYGIRIELKRTAATDELIVPLGVEISAAGSALSLA